MVGWLNIIMVSHMTVKTTLLIDEKTWAEFRKLVLSRYGSSRKLSAAVEEAIRTFNSVELLVSLSNNLGLNVNSYPSTAEIKKRRPKVSVSSGKIVRQMRDERKTRLLRLKHKNFYLEQ
jgi:hypothetical protein